MKKEPRKVKKHREEKKANSTRSKHKGCSKQITSNRLAMLSNDDVNESRAQFLRNSSKTKHREYLYECFCTSVCVSAQVCMFVWWEWEHIQPNSSCTYFSPKGTYKEFDLWPKTTTTQCIMSIRCKNMLASCTLSIANSAEGMLKYLKATPN